ncbi:MAG: hypothetical protein SFU86_01725 [Pirellulaceae bacterium]|nr:hypothetical protein [Pirellulaceae bacterium]
MSQPVPPAEQPASAPPAKKGSTVRLSIMLGILGILILALGYDYLLAKPAMDAAQVRLQKLVDERHKQGVGEGKPVVSADVQQTIGFAPTKTEKKQDETTVEWYCWWGPVPYINMNRRYLWVRYEGRDPQHVSTFACENSPDDPSASVAPTVSEPMPAVPGGGGQGHSGNTPKDVQTPPDEPAKEPAAPTGGTNE